jgi:hypothetical protein
MDHALPDPGLASDPPTGGGGGCVPSDEVAAARARHCVMLNDLAEVGMVLAGALRRQVETTGQCGPDEAASYEIIYRAVRRGIALRDKLLDESGLSEEARAAARAARDAVATERRLVVRRNQVRRAVERTIEVEVKVRGLGRSDRERLLADLHERLADPDIERALTRAEYRAIIEGICKDLEITPRKETWSDRALVAGIADTAAELQRVAEQFSPSAAAAADLAACADAPPDAAPEEAPEEAPAGSPAAAADGAAPLRKIGRFTFGPGGAVVAEEPMEPGFGDWAKAYQHQRDPPDTG